jgi:hypothetical protein
MKNLVEELFILMIKVLVFTILAVSIFAFVKIGFWIANIQTII